MGLSPIGYLSCCYQAQPTLSEDWAVWIVKLSYSFCQGELPKIARLKIQGVEIKLNSFNLFKFEWVNNSFIY